ncbi:MAG: histidinol-phosphate aminotransferase family protein [Hyphomicrobiales bacterium]|nr:histidinol-phosphate aminotransferase family protein [Hyphomicrobiales bacterium]MCP5370540.1 histidinol-phosphate aminotransferase family protein [Hyphomicrobiales bacterium]
MTQSQTPTPRPAVADPALTRPDGTAGDWRDPDRLWLDKNENGDPEMAAVVRQVLAQVRPEALYTYPETGPLYRKLAAWLGIDARSVILSAGSDGIIRAVFEAFVSPGDRVLHTAPTFAMYPVYCRIYGAEAVPVTYQRSDRGPALDADSLIATLLYARPRVVCLPNPDSPTGTVFDPADMRRIVEAAGEVGAVMLVDEAYHPFHDQTCLPWIAEYGHLVVTRSTGKAWGMAGFRIGYGAAAPGLAAILQKVRAMYETNTVAAAVFEGMLDHADAMAASVARLQAGKATFLDAMTKLRFKVLRGSGNFMHVAFGPHAARVHAALADTVYYRRDFADPCLQGYSRFSATTPALFTPVIDRITAVVRANDTQDT